MRWRNAYLSHAEVADRAIEFALRVLGRTEWAAQFVLPLLEGAQFHWVKASSSYTVGFVKRILQQDIPEPTAARLHNILDGLAQIGDEKAPAAQREIENL
jgi:hypothetical protein